MEGESPLLKEGALSLQTSLSHRELSHRTPLLQERKFVSLFVTAGFCGKVFLSDWEVRDFLQGAASRSICGGKYLRNAFNEPIGCEAAPSKKHLPPKAKTSPKSTRHQTKRNKSLPCTGGCSWGKFGEDEGGLEGEGTPSERGALLPPRSSFPHPIRASSKRSRKTLTERTERKTKRMAKASGKRVAIRGVSAGLRR